MDPAAVFTIYCEHLGASFWAEPANATSNVAFLATAIGIWWILLREEPRDRPALLLIALTICIAFGSFAFHTVPTRVTVLFDVVPIALFIYAYFLVAMHRFFGLGAFKSVAATAGFVVASLALVALARPSPGFRRLTFRPLSQFSVWVS